MEESEKRKERINAMRLEAARTTDFQSPGLAPGSLSNPLIETENVTASPHQYNTLPRFDYYTDPVSAFSGNKRKNNISPQASQGHYNKPPIPMDQGMIPNLAYHYPAVNSPDQRMFSVPRANFQGPVGSPMGAAIPLNRPQQNHPRSWVGSGVAFDYGIPPNLCSPYVDYGRGRGPQGQNNNPHYDPGRGRGRGRYGNSMGAVASGPNFMRGSSSYYRKEMVEDPWMGLNPVMWKGGGDVDCNKSWLPKSIAMKKLKSSPEAPQASIPQQSLAEYLAATFDDSVVEDEKGT